MLSEQRVDARDADLTRFAAHVAIALDRVAPGIEENLFALLTVPDRLGPAELGEAIGGRCTTWSGMSFWFSMIFTPLAAARSRHSSIASSSRAPAPYDLALSEVPFPLSRLRAMGDVEGADGRRSSLFGEGRRASCCAWRREKPSTLRWR